MCGKRREAEENERAVQRGGYLQGTGRGSPGGGLELRGVGAPMVTEAPCVLKSQDVLILIRAVNMRLYFHAR